LPKCFVGNSIHIISSCIGGVAESWSYSEGRTA